MRDFPGLYTRIKENLKPGGFVEIVDHGGTSCSDDGTLQRAPSIMEWSRLHNEACAKFGKELDVAHRHKQWMIDAGFENVKEEVVKVCLTFKFH